LSSSKMNWNGDLST